jgi:hypothetical protein
VKSRDVPRLGVRFVVRLPAEVRSISQRVGSKMSWHR